MSQIPRSYNNNEVLHIDLYKILNLPPTCTNNDIEKKYLELAKVYHPDNTKIRYKNLISTALKKNNQKGEQVSEHTIEELKKLMNDKVVENTKLFHLINNAYTKLTKYRAEYDKNIKSFKIMNLILLNKSQHLYHILILKHHLLIII
jgi:curved DNA-binding protein CbpA